MSLSSNSSTLSTVTPAFRAAALAYFGGATRLMTELMRGGELFDRIVTKTFYKEKESRDVCKILFGALRYCHEQNIARCDLKPENVLLTVN